MPRKPEQPRRQRRYDPLAVLSYIDRYQRQHRRRSPSQRLIQTGLDMSAASVVHCLLHRLERRGLLAITSYGQGRAADLALTEAGREAVATSRQRGATGGDSAG